MCTWLHQFYLLLLALCVCVCIAMCAFVCNMWLSSMFVYFMYICMCVCLYNEADIDMKTCVGR